MSLRSEIESLLFVSSRPLSVKRLVEVTGHKREEVTEALAELEKSYAERPESGVVILRNGEEVQSATSPENAEMIKTFLKDETFGELTRPALETLTIVAYRGPLAKAELEQIRGVNCSLILRNLMIRGLVEVKEEARPDGPTSMYGVTFDFIRYLGLRQVSELPDYENLRNEENLKKLIAANAAQTSNAPADSAGEASEAGGSSVDDSTGGTASGPPERAQTLASTSGVEAGTGPVETTVEDSTEAPEVTEIVVEVDEEESSAE
jgi:segregation and condensation protein B